MGRRCHGLLSFCRGARAVARALVGAPVGAPVGVRRLPLVGSRGDLGLARTAAGPLARHDDAGDEQLSSPDAPGLASRISAGQALRSDRTLVAQRDLASSTPGGERRTTARGLSGRGSPRRCRRHGREHSQESRWSPLLRSRSGWILTTVWRKRPRSWVSGPRPGGAGEMQLYRWSPGQDPGTGLVVGGDGTPAMAAVNRGRSCLPADALHLSTGQNCARKATFLNASRSPARGRRGHGAPWPTPSNDIRRTVKIIGSPPPVVRQAT